MECIVFVRRVFSLQLVGATRSSRKVAVIVGRYESKWILTLTLTVVPSTKFNRNNLSSFRKETCANTRKTFPQLCSSNFLFEEIQRLQNCKK
jgi:hypothetical protein